MADKLTRDVSTPYLQWWWDQLLRCRRQPIEIPPLPPTPPGVCPDCVARRAAAAAVQGGPDRQLCEYLLRLAERHRQDGEFDEASALYRARAYLLAQVFANEHKEDWK